MFSRRNLDLKLILSIFESLGGHVVGSSTYPAKKNDYSAAIKNLLNLTTSNHRKSILQQVIKEQVQFDARRRQDVDMSPELVRYPEVPVLKKTPNDRGFNRKEVAFSSVVIGRLLIDEQASDIY